MLTVLELRTRLGLSQRAFAALLGVSRRSVIYWERNIRLPSMLARLQMRVIARRHGLTKTTEGPMALLYDPVKMEAYLGSPRAAGVDWVHLTYAQRGSWWGHRAKYRKLKQDAAAGRVHLESRHLE